jgi:predicted DsbA family dithiol-disulfide isomerase
MTRIEVYADIVCPFTHVGLRRLSEARHERGIARPLRVRAWPLEWVNGTQLGADLVAREVAALREQVAPELFAGFDATMFPLTSIPALGLAATAYAVDDTTGAAMSMALRDALFEQGQNIADPDVLCDIGRRFDLELPDRETSERAVRSDWERGKARGVQGSPHFFVGNTGWFCPSLDISHTGDRFDIRTADATAREFYAAAFG